MQKPHPATGTFISLMLGIVCGALMWSTLCLMDDIIKVTAFLRPVANISIVKPIIGGELQEKYYDHDSFIYEGDLLLRIDVSSDVIELENSRKLMQRVIRDIDVNQSVLETMTYNIERVDILDEEAKVRSAAYLAEYRRQLGQIDIARIKLERERSMPDIMVTQQKVVDLEKEVRQTELGLASWRNYRMIEGIEMIKNLIQNQENLERRIADLERNIKNATLSAPVSGRVSETRKLNIGDYIMAGEEVIRIIPDSAEQLKVELMVDAAYIARVKIGQRATLRFPGLPPSKFGQLEATIHLIPADYTIGNGLTTYFVVEAYITEPYLVSSRGERLLLHPGVSAEGRIITEQDTVIRMLLKKLDFIN
ncbi:MAG: HlyD family secretion protein [Treponema sp.]|nr:HlyD family secretion protein [Treponema sp.]